MIISIKVYQTCYSQDISDQPLYPIEFQLRFSLSQPLACIDQHVIGYCVKLYQNCLPVNALFVSFGQAQVILVLFELGLDTTTAPVIKIGIGQQNCMFFRIRLQARGSQFSYCQTGQSSDYYRPAPLAVLFFAAYNNPFDRTEILCRFQGNLTNLPAAVEGFYYPQFDCSAQLVSSFIGIIISNYLVTSLKQIVEIFQATDTVIISLDDIGTSTFIQIQHVGSFLDQLWQGLIKLDCVGKEAIYNNLLVPGSQYQIQLTASAVMLFVKITLSSQGYLWTAGQITDITIEQLPFFGIVILITLTVGVVNFLRSFVYLQHMLINTFIQASLDHRRVRTAWQPENLEENGSRFDQFVNFYQATSSGQNSHKNGHKLLERLLFDSFLIELDQFLNRDKQAKPDYIEAKRDQSAPGRVVTDLVIRNILSHSVIPLFIGIAQHLFDCKAFY